MSTEQSYLLAAGDDVELERLRLQARVWEPQTESRLDELKIQPGWRCIDLGCGAMGILGPLARRVGPGGRVVGLDVDSRQLAGTQAYVGDSRLENVEIVEGDAYRTGLPDGGRFGMLRRIGFEDVRLRAAIIALQDGHPYMRRPIQFATTLRPGSSMAV